MKKPTHGEGQGRTRRGVGFRARRREGARNGHRERGEDADAHDPKLQHRPLRHGLLFQHSEEVVHAAPGEAPDVPSPKYPPG